MINTFRYIRENGIPANKVWHMMCNPAMSLRYLRGPRPYNAVDGLVNLLGIDRNEALEYSDEYHLKSTGFWHEVNAKFMGVRGRLPNWRVWSDFLYMVVRAKKPELMIETGPFDGQSTATILLAMDRNKHGELISIDLPAREPQAGATSKMTEPTLPVGMASAWLVPNYLRSRLALAIGDSRVMLPTVLEKWGCDTFFHDSLHTYDHMKMEYETVWPYLPQEGLLLSDDILWSNAWREFAAAQNRPYVMVGGFGAMKK